MNNLCNKLNYLCTAQIFEYKVVCFCMVLATHLIYSESREGRPLGEQLQLLQDRLNETEIVNPSMLGRNKLFT